MKTYLKYLFISIAVAFITHSCTEEDKFNNPATFDLIDGAYVQFVELPNFTVNALDINSANFTNAFIQPKGSIARIDIEVAPTIAGTTLDTLPWRGFDNFPADVSFSAQDMADFLGLDINDLSGGDSFEFFTTITLTDGRIFSWRPNEFISDGDGSVTELGGVTDATVVTDAGGGYRQAFNYSVSYVCPVDDGLYTGTYNVQWISGIFDAFGGSQAYESNFQVNIMQQSETRRVTSDACYLPGFGCFFGPITFDLICGNIVVPTQASGGGVGCSSTIFMGSNGVVFPYDNDDSAFDLRFSDSIGGSGGCGNPEYEIVLRFTKQ